MSSLCIAVVAVAGLRLLLLLLLYLPLFDRPCRRLIDHVRVAIAFGLLRQPEVRLRKPLVLGLPKRVGFRLRKCS